jgi:hypothetical protein
VPKGSEGFVFLVYGSNMAFDWKQYTGNLKWLPERTIYLTRHGSHAYGTSLPTSDLDIRGICIAPREYYHGFSLVFEQAVQKEPDLAIFELRKFLTLACDVNPNVIELLYTDPSDHLFVTPAMEKLLENRSAFLSRRVKHTFSGYALSQLKRINLHYRWLKNPPTGEPIRKEFGLPERTVIPADQLMAAKAAIQKQIDRWTFKDIENLDPATRQAMMDSFEKTLLEMTQWTWLDREEKQWVAAADFLGFSTNFIEVLDKERRYDGARKNWTQYNEWKRSRNPDRAVLEEKWGFDTKHGLHLVRLLRMCREILTTGQVHVRRPDAEELLAIRAGAWDYYKLVEWAESEDKSLTELMSTSPLPYTHDRKKIDALCIELVEASLKNPL